MRGVEGVGVIGWGETAHAQMRPVDGDGVRHVIRRLLRQTDLLYARAPASLAALPPRSGPRGDRGATLAHY